MKIAMASDHGGFALKASLMKHLDEEKIEYIDCGTYSEESCDYPDFAEKACKLVQVTRECFFEAIKYCREGYRLSDIGTAVQTHAEANGYGVVRDYVGHGIGRNMHEDPEVPNYYSPRARLRLRAGMAIAVEPMINMGTWKVRQLSDGWTVETEDGLPSAHYENTILITDGDPIMTTFYEEEA